MPAKLLLKLKLTDEDEDVKELVVWDVPADKRCPQGVRYRMAFIPQGERVPVVLYDNHHPKGHHKHIEGRESSYQFLDVDQLIDDFEKDIHYWKKTRR